VFVRNGDWAAAAALPVAGAAEDARVKEATATVRAALPRLTVYCSSGPQAGPEAYPARWLPVWPGNNNSNTTNSSSNSNGSNKDAVGAEGAVVVPVLFDDLAGATGRGGGGSGVARSTLLRREHRMQPLGVLTHHLRPPPPPGHRHESALEAAERAALAAIEPRLLRALGIARTSDPKAFSLKVLPPSHVFDPAPPN